MQDGQNQNRAITDLKKSTVGKMVQAHPPDIFKTDEKVKGIFRSGKHGVARGVSETNGHIGIALVIPERSLLDIAINERML